MYEFIEFCATLLNFCSHMFMMVKVYYNPKDPVPIVVIILQMCANSCWITYASIQGDYYLTTTASTSLLVQTFTFKYLLKSQHSDLQKVKESDSEEELPQL